MGDCLGVMRKLAKDGTKVQSIVTDPPYGLSFMGHNWDHGVPGKSYWKAAFDLLPPGGHLLAFGGTRTYHRMASAIEDAGFEIRDQIGWLYGTGFPKSLDVSKGIDRSRKEDVEPLRVICRAIRAAMDGRGLKSRDLVSSFGNCNPRLLDHWAARDTDSQPTMPTWEQWETLVTLFPELRQHNSEAWRLNGRKGEPGDAWNKRELIGMRAVNAGVAFTSDGPTELTVTAPATDAARQWQGWGTALKPAWEPICVARKPLIGTVAQNVQQFGTGAINIDACRVEPNGEKTGSNGACGLSPEKGWNSNSMSRSVTQPQRTDIGRWPANVVHSGDAEVEAAFAAFGEKGAAGQVNRQAAQNSNSRGAFAGIEKEFPFHADTGTASRFFYCAKASKSDRAGSTHPTVKPVSLMKWLVRMVTPPGGTVLDPFAGTGTTLAAGLLEGFSVIGIEKDPEYYADIRRRLAALQAEMAEQRVLV